MLPLYIASAVTGILGIADNEGPARSELQAILNISFLFMTVYGLVGVFVTTYQTILS